MQSFVLSASVILPLCILMVTGYAVRKVGVLDEKGLDVLNKLVFNLFLPVTLCKMIIDGDLNSAFDPGLLAITVGSVIFTVTVLLIIVPRFVKDGSRAGVIIQGIFRSNATIFGLSVMPLLYPGGDMSLVAMLVTVVALMYNVYAIYVLEKFSKGKTTLKAMAMSLIKNPLVIGILIGITIKLFRITLPDVIYSPISGLAGVTTPVSFLILGASFTFKSAMQDRKALTSCVIGKLFIVPLIAVGTAALLGWRGESIFALLAIFGAPTSISSFPMAKQMGGDGGLAGEIVVFTSALSMVSIFVWIFMLSTLGIV